MIAKVRSSVKHMCSVLHTVCCVERKRPARTPNTGIMRSRPFALTQYAVRNTQYAIRTHDHSPGTVSNEEKNGIAIFAL